MRSEWEATDTSLTRAFLFKDFASAFRFAERIRDVAERAQHHPELLIGWGKCVVTLSSHDVGKITDRDVALAEKIDMIQHDVEKASH